MSYKIKNRAIIYEFLLDEVVLANLETGIYYSIRNTGIPVWLALMSGQPIENIAQSAKSFYSKDCSAEIFAFVKRLLDEKLIIEEPFQTPSDFHFEWPKQWHDLILEKYEEIKNLLALDPIHEVDELGWPNKIC